MHLRDAARRTARRGPPSPEPSPISPETPPSAPTHPNSWCLFHEVFDPCFAAMHVTQEWVQNLSHIIPLHVHNLIPGMITELSAYRVLANQADGFNRADVREYSEALLKWWKVPPFPAPPMLTIMLAMQHTMQPACSPCAAHVRSPPLPVITPGEPGDHLQLGQGGAHRLCAHLYFCGQ